MLWFTVKGERKGCYHLRNLAACDGDATLATGCRRLYGAHRARETREDPPPVRERCRGCDAWYTRHRRLVELEAGLSTSKPEGR